MAGKCDDTRAIPLCFRHHQEYHGSHGRLTFAKWYNLNYEEIIDELNKLYKEVNGSETIS